MEVKIILLAIISSVILIDVSSEKSKNYCEIQTCLDKHKDNTMCLYKPKQVSSSCKEKGSTGNLDVTFRKGETNAIVAKHNELRKKLAAGEEKRGSNGPQPAAEEMPDLVWDEELAKMAQTWANQCIYEHDDCRNVDRFKVGQNIAEQSTTEDISTLDPAVMVEEWYNEVQYFDKDIVEKYNGKPGKGDESVGHYTQLVWAESKLIGCGIRYYINEEDSSMKSQLLVCNYGPAGNVIGKPIYKIKK